MKFSIATPTLNCLDKLKGCVGSVRGQTGATTEHLIQDAVSGDGTGAWLASQPDLAAVSERDDSMYDAIERGWRRASGDIFSWLNSDEQYLPGTLQAVEAAFNTHPDVDFVYGNSIIVGASGDAIAARREIPLRHVYVRNGTLYSYSCTLFFRRRLWDQGLLSFNRSLRYAADADLVLRLLEAGKRHHHLRRYLSLFMLDGGNLSCSPAMLTEIDQVQASHGGASTALARRAVMACRALEKLLSGCYRHETVQYQFTVDDVPSYRAFEGRDLSGRFDINLFSAETT